MFGIVKENKFVLIDEDKERLLNTLKFMPQYSVDDVKGYTEDEDEVEVGYDNNTYVKGYAPVKPQELVDEERVAELEKYLNETDWYSIRYAETGKEIPADVLQARQEAREEISKLRGE